MKNHEIGTGIYSYNSGILQGFIINYNPDDKTRQQVDKEYEESLKSLCLFCEMGEWKKIGIPWRIHSPEQFFILIIHVVRETQVDL